VIIWTKNYFHANANKKKLLFARKKIAPRRNKSCKKLKLFETNKETDRQKDRKRDKQTERQTNRERHRQRHL
jgi:hypothetical protein